MDSINTQVSDLKPSSKFRIPVFLQVFIAVAFLIWGFSQLSPSLLFERLAEINLIWVIIEIPLFLAFVFFGVLSLPIILPASSGLTFKEIIHISLYSMSVGVFTPAMVGELGSIAYLITKRSNVSAKTLLPLLVLDKAIKGGVAVLLGVLGFVFLSQFDPLAARIMREVILFASIFALLSLIALRFRWAKKFIKRLVWPFFPKDVGVFAYFVLIAFALIRTLIGALMLWVGLRAFNVSPPFFPLAIVSFSARLITYLPLTVNGIGVFEVVLMNFFAKVGVVKDATFIAVLLTRVVVMTTALCIFVFYTLFGSKAGNIISKRS